MTVTGLQLQFDCFNENDKTAEAYKVMQNINNLLHEHMGDEQLLLMGRARTFNSQSFHIGYTRYYMSERILVADS